MGECIGFEKLLRKWEKWEIEYARRGFRTISVDKFTDLGGYGKSIDDLLRQVRDSDENPKYHAKIYREEFLGKMEPSIDLNGIMNNPNKIHVTTYRLPSTED